MHARRPRAKLLASMAPRPRKPPTVSWSIRVQVDELERWKEAADREKLEISAFVRRVVGFEADRLLGTEPRPKPAARRK